VDIQLIYKNMDIKCVVFNNIAELWVAFFQKLADLWVQNLNQNGPYPPKIMLN